VDKISGGIFALLGVLLGGWIAWRYQHRQWILENKKKEYREILDGLFQASEEIIKARPNISADVIRSSDDSCVEGKSNCQRPNFDFSWRLDNLHQAVRREAPNSTN
jgi:hypothetical protein